MKADTHPGRFERERCLMEDLVRSLVDLPERAHVTRLMSQQICVLEVHVDPHDVRKVIGRRGRTAEAIREILLCWQGRRGGGVRFMMEIIEPPLSLEAPEPSEEDREAATLLATRGSDETMVVTRRGRSPLVRYREAAPPSADGDE